MRTNRIRYTCRHIDRMPNQSMDATHIERYICDFLLRKFKDLFDLHYSCLPYNTKECTRRCEWRATIPWVYERSIPLSGSEPINTRSQSQGFCQEQGAQRFSALHLLLRPPRLWGLQLAQKRLQSEEELLPLALPPELALQQLQVV